VTIYAIGADFPKGRPKRIVLTVADEIELAAS
jgi:hypothetical protein